jgi:hypothetical protein
MSEHTTICPSGLKLVVRGLKASEMDLFANKQEVASKMISNRILSACTVAVEDYGPLYDGLKFDEEGFWDKVLVCDRFSTLLATRIATHGSDYSFRVKCSDDKCDKHFEWGLDLNVLPQYQLPEASITNALEDAPFRAQLANGDQFFFRLIRGKDERELANHIEKNFRARVTTGLARRISRVISNGKEFTDYYLIAEWVRSLSVPESMELVSEMDAVDGGYETQLEIYCPFCSNEMHVNIPFDEGFWIKTPPSSSKNKRVIRQSPG